MDNKLEKLEQKVTKLEREKHRLPPKEFGRRVDELKREIAKLHE